MCMHTHKAMAVSLWKGKDLVVHEAGCLSSPNMVLESWEGPRELLVFDACWNQEEEGSKHSEEMSQDSVNFPVKIKTSKQKSQAPFFCFLLCGLPPEGVDQI